MMLTAKFLFKTQTTAFVNHALIAGKSGSGKSNALEVIARSLIGKKKVIDLYDSGRFENMLYGLPETSPGLIKKARYLVRREPSGVKNEIFMVNGPNLKFEARLPKIINVMSLEEESLELEDIFYLFGSSDALRGTLATIESREGNMTFSQLRKFFKTNRAPVGVHRGTYNSIQRQINRWYRSGIFSLNFPRINLKDACQKTDTITSFSTYLCEPEQEPVVYGLILKQLFELKRRRKIAPRVAILIREVSNFMLPEFSFPRQMLLRIIREGRDIGCDLYADTQRPKDLPPLFRRQFGYYIQLKADFADAETILEIQEVPQRYLYKVPRLGLGEAIVATGMRFDYPVMFPPAPHLHKKPGLKVLNVLAEAFDGWVKYEVREEEEEGGQNEGQESETLDRYEGMDAFIQQK